VGALLEDVPRGGHPFRVLGRQSCHDGALVQVQRGDVVEASVAGVGAVAVNGGVVVPVVCGRFSVVNIPEIETTVDQQRRE